MKQADNELRSPFTTLSFIGAYNFILLVLLRAIQLLRFMNSSCPGAIHFIFIRESIKQLLAALSGVSARSGSVIIK